jgi:hypothetical protein
MSRTGVANLPLHGGNAPGWLTGRMCKLAREISSIVIDEYGADEFLSRLSDPFWFQAFGCVLGYDWHSSGVTTVVTGVLKRALSPEEHGIAVCGGKGRTSRKTPEEIVSNAETFGLTDQAMQRLTYISKMTAKVDNAAIQAGYQLYHHAFLMTERGGWAVVQQGMSAEDRTARRYHWLSDHTSSLIVEPHNAIVGTKRPTALNMTAKDSEGARRASVDIAKEPTQKLIGHFEAARPLRQKSLREWLPIAETFEQPKTLSMPRGINWKTMKQVYDFQPSNYEELLSIKGVGPSTVRGLALIGELIYGEKPSWEDPVKYSFAYGGKDGVPFPVDRRAMDESVQMLCDTVKAARIGDKERLHSLQRLRRFVPENAKFKQKPA